MCGPATAPMIFASTLKWLSASMRLLAVDSCPAVSGLASSGRYLACTVVIPDRPGGLAGLLGVIAETGANVIDLRHERTSAYLHIGEVDVAVQLETKGAEHATEVLAHLRAAGYGVRE